MKGDLKCCLINGHFRFSSHTKNLCFFAFFPGITFFYQELIFACSFKLQFQKLLSKTFIMMLLKQMLVRKSHLATVPAQRSYPVHEHGCWQSRMQWVLYFLLLSSCGRRRNGDVCSSAGNIWLHQMY